MNDVTEVLIAARRAFDRCDWAAARDGFRSIRDEHELSADDLSALGELGVVARPR